jgi:hypothetical protein
MGHERTQIKRVNRNEIGVSTNATPGTKHESVIND